MASVWASDDQRPTRRLPSQARRRSLAGVAPRVGASLGACAAGGTRTRKSSRDADFQSAAFTSFATAACGRRAVGVTAPAAFRLHPSSIMVTSGGKAHGEPRK